MCEAYSIAVLHLRELRTFGPNTEHITKYEGLIADTEHETSYYLTMRARLSAQPYRSDQLFLPAAGFVLI